MPSEQCLKHSCVFLLLVLCYPTCGIKKTFVETDWRVHNFNKSINIPANVPGGIYSDLIEAKILNDIFYQYNDVKYRWVGNETWTYTTNIAINSKYLRKNQIRIVFEGLDTFTSVYLNNIHLGETNNMFVRYNFDVKNVLKEGTNNLLIVFKSPIKESQELYKKQAVQYIVPPDCVPREYNGECHANFVRKMQASFGWDWGPAFPSVGIWKPVYFQFFNSAVLRDIIFILTDEDDNWKIDLDIYLESYNTHIEGTVSTNLQTDVDIVNIFTIVNVSLSGTEDYKQNISFLIPKLHVDLWWPNGYGKQKLYRLKVQFVSKDESEKSSKTINVGFRNIQLVQNSLGSGLTFYFKVNHVPIFAKGSNWIPTSILPEKGANLRDIEFLLTSAKDVHMNMLRVWGGGLYESERFYETADKCGILIWQDFMFACSMYPINYDFLQNVKTEVVQQVRRLQYHPSIAVWAGNNENEAALVGNWYHTQSMFYIYKRDYIKLYVETIKKVCLENDITRSFIVSSPSNGDESEKEGFVSSNPYNPLYGDVHFYNYIFDGWQQNIYPKSRFVSEYGYQSMPYFSTMQSATNVSSDLEIDSNFLTHRQHHKDGYAQMKTLITQQLNLPNNTTSNYLQTFIYYSQIYQAEAIKAETEFYRQWRSSVDAQDKGLTMGALYWQLNDVWQAPSWSSIDFKRRWKMLHYHAARFFYPVLVSANLKPSRTMIVYVISDLTMVIPEAILNIVVYKWNSFEPLFSEKKTLSISPGCSAAIFEVWIDKYLEGIGCGTIEDARYSCFMYFKLFDKNEDLICYENYMFPARLKLVHGLQTPNLTVEVFEGNKIKGTEFSLNITTTAITPFVWLETRNLNGIFSENGFLQVVKQKQIKYKINTPITVTELKSSLKITSLLSKEHL